MVPSSSPFLLLTLYYMNPFVYKILLFVIFIAVIKYLMNIKIREEGLFFTQNSSVQQAHCGGEVMVAER